MFFRKGLLLHVANVMLLSAVFTLSSAEIEEERSIEIHGLVQMQGGQFVNYKYRSDDFSHKWLQRNLLGIKLDARLNQWLDVHLLTGALLTFNTQKQQRIMRPDDFANQAIYGFILDQAEMIIHAIPDPNEMAFDIGIGLWQQKYNTEARNLGEYLFRSGAYPGYIYQYGFDECFYNVAGIRLMYDGFGIWHNELMLTSEIITSPFTDFSLAYLTDVSLLKKAFTVGAGVQLYRCFSADKDLTSPREVWRAGTPQGPAPNYYLEESGQDEFGLPLYDTLWYTFAGTKIMARFAFDPKPLFAPSIFGEEDLKVYAEAAILGVKNYPNNTISTDNEYTFDNRPVSEFGYDTLLQKMPIMFGFNFPTFKVLDVLSLEFEYYGKKYVNAVPIPRGSATGGYYPASCLPVARQTGDDKYGEYDSLYVQGGALNWKWSIYARKTLFGHFTITAQAARDHILNTTRYLSMREVDLEEALVKKNHWYWMLKFSADF